METVVVDVLELLGAFFLMPRMADGIPCILSNTERGLHVSCNNRRITNFQKTWSTPVILLNLSKNNLTDVSGLTNPCFFELRHLDLSRNLLHFVPSENLQHLKKLEWLDLSYNNLGVIPSCAFQGLDHLEFLALCHTGLVNLTQDAFRELPKLLALDLSENTFSEVPESAIQHLSHLKSLNLSYNAITIINNMTFANVSQLLNIDIQGNNLIFLEQKAFVGLNQLVNLDLSHNQLILDDMTYPSGVFNPLTSLQILTIQGNDKVQVGHYPENIFTPLTSLKSLTIDTFPGTHFGAAFSMLTSLISLDLSYNCKIVHFTNQSFEAFHNSSLQILNLRGCRISSYEKCVLCFLPRLQTLLVENMNVVDANSALGLLYGLHFQNISVISVRNCCDQPTVLETWSFQFLINICAKTVTLVRCKLVEFPVSFLTMLSENLLGACIEHLDLSQNMLSGRHLLKFYFTIYRLPNLQTLQVQNQASHGMSDSCLFTETKCDNHFREPVGFQTEIYIPLSRALRYLDVAGITSIGPLPDHVHIMSADNLTFVNMTTCGIERCNSTITGLTALETFDLSNQFCKVLSVNIFQNMTSLRTLKVSYLSLDQNFMESHGHDLLGHLQHLEHLDLSNNGLQRLPLNMLDGQPRLVELLLAKNRFQRVPVDVSLHPGLRLLDLSNNIITTLSLQERNVFDRLAANHTFYLRIRKNLMICACMNLDLIQWLANTEVRLDGDNFNDKYDDNYDDNGRSYPCVSEDGTITNTSAVNENFVYQWRRCMGERTFWVALSALCLQLLALFIALLLSRSWTHVLYVINVLRKQKIPRRQDFQNDTYIGYVDEDVELVMALVESLQRRNVLRMFLRYIEEPYGCAQAENIVKSMDISWKIVILMTSNVTRDHLAAMIIRQAKRSITSTMPDRVIIVFADDPARLPHMTSLQHLLSMVPEKNVFYIPRETPSHHLLWDRLADAIFYEEFLNE